MTVSRKKSDADPTGRTSPQERIPDDVRATVPRLYAVCGSKAQVARELAISTSSVTRILDELSGEEWERIQKEQAAVIGRRSVELVFKALDLIPEKMDKATLRDTIGAYKILVEKAAALGVLLGGGEDTGAEADRFLREVEVRRLENDRAAMLSAMRTKADRGEDGDGEVERASVARRLAECRCRRMRHRHVRACEDEHEERNHDGQDLDRSKFR